ncbi:hypothetical protein Tco_0368124 [Tanacetum coccineum]
MLTLCVFGITIGEKFGSAYLLKLYLAGAFVGSAFFLVHTSFLALSSKNKGSNKHNPSKVCGLGASAAVKQTYHAATSTQKHTTLTLSAHMGGCLVAAIAWSRIKRGRLIGVRGFLGILSLGVDGGSVQLGDNRTCTIKGTGKVKIQLHDGSSFILEDVRYVPGLRRSLISLGTLEKEGYTVKMQMGRIKVIKGCRVMMTGIRKKNCVYTLEAKVMTFGVQKHGGSKQVGLKQLGSKQVGFKQLGHKQVGFKQLGPGVETGVHGVQDEKRVWFEVELQGAQGDREAEEREKVHLGIKVGANITVTRVTGQEGAEGNVAEKKKGVYES